MNIVLPHYKCISWNKLYSQNHWSIRANLATDAHTEVRYAVLKAKEKMIKGRVDIEVIAYLKRPIDPDNICAKLLIDGLKGLVIEDDTTRYIRAVTTVCIKSDKDYTEIIIEPIHEQVRQSPT